MKRKLISIIVFLLVLTVGFSAADWRWNPFTNKLDYYVGSGTSPTFLAPLTLINAAAATVFSVSLTGQVYIPGLTVSHPVFTNADNILVSTGTVPSDQGGTGIDSSGVTNGQLLIGNTAGNVFALATLTGTAGEIIVTNAASSITLSTPQGINTTSDVQFADIYHTGFIGTNYYNCGNSGASITIDWNNGNLQYITLTAVGVDITFTEPPHPGKCELWIIQDGTGNRTIDWEHEISPKWPGDVEPTLSTAAAAVDVVVFTFIGGTTYRGLFNGDFK